jgi:hypothetical protein
MRRGAARGSVAAGGCVTPAGKKGVVVRHVLPHRPRRDEEPRVDLLVGPSARRVRPVGALLRRLYPQRDPLRVMDLRAPRAARIPFDTHHDADIVELGSHPRRLAIALAEMRALGQSIHVSDTITALWRMKKGAAREFTRHTSLTCRRRSPPY